MYDRKLIITPVCIVRRVLAYEIRMSTSRSRAYS